MRSSNKIFMGIEQKNPAMPPSSAAQGMTDKFSALPTELQRLTRSFLTTLPDLITLSKVSSKWNKAPDHQEFIQSEYEKRMKVYFPEELDRLAEQNSEQKPSEPRFLSSM